MIELTNDIRYAAARDAGNRSMREGNRTVWAQVDLEAAYAEYARLVPKRMGRYASGVQACHELLES